MKKQRMMAFWKYDLYPYLLWGEIYTKFPPKLWKNKLTYYIPSYQSYMAPEFILDYKEGEVLGNLLKHLKSDLGVAMKQVRDEYNSHLKRVLSENGVEYEP